jgi:sugar fermentation stimulation protein A
MSILFDPPLVQGRLIRRYKRFLADVELTGGEIIVAHCANPGSMMGLADAGNPVWLRPTPGAGRKLAYALEVVEASFAGERQKVAINTGNPNRLAESSIRHGLIEPLSGYAAMRREVRYGVNSRVDLLLTDPHRPPCFVEVKNVHLMRQAGLAEFPDCVTARGAKHLADLAREVAAGHRAVMLYVIQMRAERFALAQDLDEAYALAFSRARSVGVEAYAYACDVDETGVRLVAPVPILS